MNFGSVFIFAHNWSECSFSLFHLGFYQELIFYSDPHQNKCFEAMTKLVFHDFFQRAGCSLDRRRESQCPDATKCSNPG